MGTELLDLLPAEKEALLEALRRDLRSQRSLAMQDTPWTIYHNRNVRLNLRLLEALNPKHKDFAKSFGKDSLIGGVSSKDVQLEQGKPASVPPSISFSKYFCSPV